MILLHCRTKKKESLESEIMKKMRESQNILSYFCAFYYMKNNERLE